MSVFWYCIIKSYVQFKSSLNLVTGQSLATKYSSLKTLCGATEPSGYGLRLMKLTGMVGCFVSLLRFSVSQTKLIQKQTRPLGRSLLQLLQQTQNKCLIQSILGCLVGIVSRALSAKCETGHSFQGQMKSINTFMFP